jgi:predicted  nucleic acid-binding Zn-ribbon protein
MKMAMPRVPFALSLLALLRCFASVQGAEVSISPTQKVIQMLTNMATKAKTEKNDEEVEFSKFSTWCKEESRKLTAEIEKNTAEIESLTAEIDELESTAKQLEKEIAQLNADVTKYDADMKKETAEREKENAAFKAEEQDYSESVDALARALQVLKSQDVDRTGASSALVEISKDDKLPAKAKSVVAAFVGMVNTNSADPMDYKAPEAYGYEFQSGSIVDMLKKLEDEFRTKLGECQKEEMNSQHAYAMVMLDLKDSKENAETDISDKTAQMKAKIAKAAENKKQLAATESMKEANEKTLKDMKTECFEKQLSFDEKQKLRAEEIEAIEKAVEILSSPEVSGNSEKYLELAQSKKATSLIQADHKSYANSQGIRRKVREFLEGEGHRLNSKALSMLAEKIAADPFAKVKKLIDQMITRLLEEAKADADHEGFCDTEMGKSKVTRTRLQEEIDALNAAVENGKATILDLTSSTETLTKEVADLVAAMKEAAELREQEKKTNAQTVEDAKAAQKAVAAATAVLKDFYKKAMTATAFVQLKATKPEWGLKLGIKMGSDEWKSLANPQYKGDGDTGHKEGMQTFGATQKGQQSENEYGVVALLEVIQSDFANLEATTLAAEAESQKAYEDFMNESKKSQAKKERKIEMNDSDKAAAESQLQTDIADLKATQDELIAAEAYYERLVPQCIDKGMTFEERTKARESEIASLKEALGILDTPDMVTSA